MTFLSVSGLRFSYGHHAVLDGIDLEIERGQVVSLIGRNGSGKTTFLRCLNRIGKYQQGRISIEGEDVAAMGAAELATRFGYVPQSAPANFPATVVDVVMLGRLPHLMWRVGDKDMELVMGIIRRLNLEHLAFRQFNELSGGERQKVLIARALAQEPRVLLLDEPTSNLDILHQLEVMEAVRDEVKKRGEMTAIISIHDLNLAARYSDAIAVIQGGRMRGYGPPEEILTGELVSEIYGVRSRIGRDEESGCLTVLPIGISAGVLGTV